MRRLALLAICLTAAAGCAGRQSAVDDATTRPTRVEPLPLSGLVAAINENNQKLPSLWASGYFEALLKQTPDDDGRFVNGQIVVQHLKPDRLFVKAEKDAFGDLFEFGTDGRTLFLKSAEEDVTYVGTAGRLDPNKVAGLAVRPDLILQVLGHQPAVAGPDAFPGADAAIRPGVGSAPRGLRRSRPLRRAAARGVEGGLVRGTSRRRRTAGPAGDFERRGRASCPRRHARSAPARPERRSDRRVASSSLLPPDRRKDADRSGRSPVRKASPRQLGAERRNLPIRCESRSGQDGLSGSARRTGCDGCRVFSHPLSRRCTTYDRSS